MTMQWETVSQATCHSEGDVETRVLIPILEALDWPRDEIHAKVPVSFRIKGKKGHPFEADFAVAPSTPMPPTRAWAVFEAKKPTAGLEGSHDQAWSYAYALAAAFFLVTDGVDLELWQTGWFEDNKRVLCMQIRELHARHGELDALLRREAVLDYYDRNRLPRLGVSQVDISLYLDQIRLELQEHVLLRRVVTTGTGNRLWVSVGASDLEISTGRVYQLTGTGGRGKTALLRSLAADLALASRQATSSLPKRVPILIRATESSGDLLAAAALQFANIPQLASAAAFQAWLAKTDTLIVVDDWDRLDPTSLVEAEAALRALRGLPTCIVIASRPDTRTPTGVTGLIALYTLEIEEQREFVDGYIHDENTATAVLQWILVDAPP